MAIKKNGKANDNAINYEVIEECGTVAERNGGYELKLRYISWNGKDPRYDLRPWKVDDEGKETCNKGITLTGEELEALGVIILRLLIHKKPMMNKNIV